MDITSNNLKRPRPKNLVFIKDPINNSKEDNFAAKQYNTHQALYNLFKEEVPLFVGTTITVYNLTIPIKPYKLHKFF